MVTNRFKILSMSISIALLLGVYAQQEAFENSYVIPGTDVTLQFVAGDIVNQPAQAIVNAANARIINGAGVTGAIFSAAGAANLEKIINTLPQDKNGIRCNPGGAAITASCGSLLDNGIEYIIHAVGPDCRIDAQKKERKSLLTNAYQHALARAHENSIETIAIPFLSVGVYAYPLSEAIELSLKTVIAWVQQHKTSMRKITFVVYPGSPDFESIKNEINFFCAKNDMRPSTNWFARYTRPLLYVSAALVGTWLLSYFFKK